MIALKPKYCWTRYALILRALPGASHQDAASVANRYGQFDSDPLFSSSNEVLHVGRNASKSVSVVLTTNATGVTD